MKLKDINESLMMPDSLGFSVGDEIGLFRCTKSDPKRNNFQFKFDQLITVYIRETEDHLEILIVADDNSRSNIHITKDMTSPRKQVIRILNAMSDIVRYKLIDATKKIATSLKSLR